MQVWTLLSFVLFTVAVALFSYLKTRNHDMSTNDGYFLGGRSLSGIYIAGSLLLTNLSAEQLVGLNGNGFSSGLSSMAWEITSGITLVMMATLFLPRYLKGGFTTIPEFLEKRYDKGTRNIVTALFLISLSVVTMPTVLYAGALAITSLFDLSGLLHISQMTALTLIVVLIGIIGSLYTIIGGLKAVAVSDTFNGVGLLIGGFTIPILGFMKLGHGNLFHGINQIIVNHPEKIDTFTTTGATPIGAVFTGVILVNMFYWCCNQEIVQRGFAAKDLSEGQKGVLYAGLVKVLIPIALVFPGIIAFHLYGNQISNQDMAYAYLVRHVLPGPLLGLFAAVLFGAVLSAFNGALNSATTMFSINIYKPMVDPNVSDQKLVKLGRYFGIAMVIFSVMVAPNIAKAPEGLYVFMKSVMGYINIPTLSVVVMGFATKKVPAIGAKLAIAFFLIAYSLYKFVFKWDINYLYIYGILFLCCVSIMLLAGKIAPKKPEQIYILKDVGVVDLTPWRLARPVSAVIILTIAFVYCLFSPLGVVGHVHYGMRAGILFLIYVCASIGAFYLFKNKLNYKQFNKNTTEGSAE